MLLGSMNCVVTKGRCSLKQHNVGPLVQSSTQANSYIKCWRLSPLGELRNQDLIDDNMSDVTYPTVTSDLDDDVDELQDHQNTDYDVILNDGGDGENGGSDC